MKLSDSQKLFKKNMLDGQSDPKAIKELKPAGKLSLDQAFQLYHSIYDARLTDVLMAHFGAVRWVLGKDLFNSVCRKYIESQPSVTYNLRNYGRTFPEFLKEDHGSKVIPFIYDLARFEWTLKQVQDSPSPFPLTGKHIEELLHSEDFKIQFIDAMEIFESPYAVYDIWDQRNSPSYQFEDINWNHPENLLIYKNQKKIFIDRIDAVETEVLNDLKLGTSVSSALADFSTLLTPDKVVEFYQLLANTGIVEDVIVLET
ncbi:MAG: HvfC/BufC family peptide modification chaperone [Bdellovibrio sp.]